MRQCLSLTLLDENHCCRTADADTRMQREDSLPSERACLVVSDDEKEPLSRRMRCAPWKDSPLSSSFLSDVSLGKSSRHSFSPLQLRIISSDGWSLQNAQAPIPRRMKVNSGKSTPQWCFFARTLKYHLRTTLKSVVTKHKSGQPRQVYSSLSFFETTLKSNVGTPRKDCASKANRLQPRQV